MTESTTNDLPEEQLPQEVVAALRTRYGPRVNGSEAVDRAILADAADHLRTISTTTPGRAPRRGRFWMAVSTGSLAAATLLFVVWPGSGRQVADMTADTGKAGFVNSEVVSSRMAAGSAVLAQDVDLNGTVNILDAFALARRINAGDAGPEWDQNDDGQMTDDDVQAIANMVVML